MALRPIASFRPIVFWTHLVLALAAGLIIALLSLTGALLAFEKQAIAWADPRVSVPGTMSAMSAERVVAGAVVDDPTMATATLVVPRDVDRPWQLSTRERRVLIDPYTGASLGEGANGWRTFFRTVTQVHRWLALNGEGSRPWGKAITGAANLAFVAVLVSGLVIWVPRRATWAALRAVAVPRLRARGRLRDWNWHHALGIWSLLPLLAMSVSGVVISYAWAGTLLARATGAPTTPAAASPVQVATTRPSLPPLAGLDRALDVARDHDADWRRLTVRLPAAGDGAIGVTVDTGTGGQPQHRTPLSIDRATGAVRSAEAFADLPPHRRARPINRFLHTGEVLGLAGQAAFGLASLAAVALAWTGFALSWRRFARATTGRAADAGTSIDPG